ncbi:ABC transporter ATP-binding protein [Ruminococcus albus]|uniref:Putative ABC transport system ATP-binding protein n=1 Tax=Ruminococcus albus TaxID=1264 RepID=A0A1I1QWF7_RUMAL|nr:ABC transporter ATP-binding protein [Ruminococcus albus]SFD24208.1 putative ABC transport system ATP-binding protein [Ruminococcus albus]
MIKINDLYKSFNGEPLFEGISLEIPDNSMVAIMGKSGSGKTTLLNIIGAIEPFDSGEVSIDGIPLSKKFNKLKLFRDKIGFLFQNFALIENMTVYDNLDIVKKKYRNDISLEECLERVELKDKKGSKIYTLSGGQQQRVALARLMLKKCDIVLADEPTGSLDATNRDIIMNILSSIHKQGKTVIIVTHDPMVAKKCENVIEICDGKIV